MQRWFRPTRRTRLKIALLAVLAMLFQQVALAGYLCSPADMPPDNAALAAHCEAMPMVDGQVPAKPAPALCGAHCAGHVLAAQDVHAPAVPPLLLPALLPDTIAFAALPSTHTAREHAAAWRLSGIPAVLRFRVLLI